MGRSKNNNKIPTGLEPRKNCIRLTFQWQGQRIRAALDIAPTAPNLKYAARTRDEIIRRINQGTFEMADYFPDHPLANKETDNPTFKEIADVWMLSKKDLTKSTVGSYKQMLNAYFMPQLKDIPIKEITYRKLVEVMSSKDWGAMKTRNNTLIVLRGIFEVAYIDGLISDNPAMRLKNIKSQSPAPDPLTLNEADKIINFIKQYKGEQCANYYEFAIFTGMRTSELISLRWSDIDFNYQLARVQRAKVRGTIKSTKTGRIRDIELNSRALAVLNRQRLHTFLIEGEIFLHPGTHKPYFNDQAPSLLWNFALKSLGIRHRVCYQTRHTFATLNLMAGANPMWVSQQMGHTTMKMLLERYSKWIGLEDQSKEKNKLDNALKSSSKFSDYVPRMSPANL
jgi:integrase